MELWDALKGRRSIRHFTGDPVPDSDLRRIIAAAGLAPNAGNQQMWRFIAIRNKEMLGQMRKAVLDKVDEMLTWKEAEAHQARLKAVKGYGVYFADAPVAIAVLSEPYHNTVDQFVLPDHGLTFEEIYHLRGAPSTQSVGAALMGLCLAAHELGYGTCWMTGPNYAGLELEKMLGVEPPWRLTAFVALGVPAEHPAARPRKDVSEILRIIE